MMDTQLIIVGIVILIAVGYAASVLLRKSKAFSRNTACSDDCGCSSNSKTHKIAH